MEAARGAAREAAVPAELEKEVRAVLDANSDATALEGCTVADGCNAALLGVHLCGELSLRAITAFEQCALVKVLVLMPCCLPKQALGIAPAEVYESKRDAEQYVAWAAHLEARLRRGGHTVGRSEAKCMLSCKNELITAMKRQ